VDSTENTASNNPSTVVMGDCLVKDRISFLQEHCYWPLPSSACSFSQSHSNSTTCSIIFI
jgi:hypothetical protein